MQNRTEGLPRAEQENLASPRGLGSADTYPGGRTEAEEARYQLDILKACGARQDEAQAPKVSADGPSDNPYPPETPQDVLDLATELAQLGLIVCNDMIAGDREAYLARRQIAAGEFRRSMQSLAEYRARLEAEQEPELVKVQLDLWRRICTTLDSLAFLAETSRPEKWRLETDQERERVALAIGSAFALAEEAAKVSR